MPFIDKEAFAGGHVPFPNGGVGRSSHHESVEHSNTIDVARVTPVQKKRKLHSVYQQSLHEGISKSKCHAQSVVYFKTPIHSVSSVLVDHSLAVESSEPVTSMEPSSESAMQLTLSSWSPEKSMQNYYEARIASNEICTW